MTTGAHGLVACIVHCVRQVNLQPERTTLAWIARHAWHPRAAADASELIPSADGDAPDSACCNGMHSYALHCMGNAGDNVMHGFDSPAC